jgi:uncharacterized protein YndB with AHSA1/START domain
MPTLHKEITVKAPVEKIFEYVDEPKHFPEIWPSMFEVTDVKTLPKGGHTFGWFYNMAGTRFKGTSETFEYVPYERIIDKTHGDFEGKYAWKFFGENGFTKIEFEADFEFPTTFKKEDRTFVMRRTEFDADALMSNLKAKFES